VIGVSDVAAQRERLVALDIEVGPLHHIEGMIDHFDFSDADGNALSLYTEL